MKYAFTEQEAGNRPVRKLRKVMSAHPSAFYAWRAEPKSARQRGDERLQGLLKPAWLASGRGHVYRELTLDMRDLCEDCGMHRVARLLKDTGLRSQSGYGRRRPMRGGQPAIVAPNHLQREFTVQAPNQSWVTDITYIRTHDDWLYPSAVLDLWSRMVIGWSMGQRIDTRLVLVALTMALWRGRPNQQVPAHSDQGGQGQFTGHEWHTFLRDRNLLIRMNRRGNCHNNAVAESCYQLLACQRIKRRTYDTRQDPWSDIFNFSELLYNPTRRHSTIAGMSPVEFEQRHSLRFAGI